MRMIRFLALLGAVLAVSTADAARAQCAGDCDGGGTVTVNELIIGVNIALGRAPLGDCLSLDTNEDAAVTINELIAAVARALNGCAPEPTATATLPAVPTATDTAPPAASATATEAPASPTATATESAAPSATATEPVAATPTAPLETATPTVTSVPTETAPATPTATSGPGAVCDNGLLEPGETCAECAADCAVAPCTATTTSITVQVHFTAAPGASPTTATTLIGYRTDRVSIPGAASATSVRQRLTYPAPLPNVASPNDLDYALRVVLGRNGGLADGLLYSVRLDTCEGAPAPGAGDFACTMEACAGAGGPIGGCGCTIVVP